jgi:hypothetical protein
MSQKFHQQTHAPQEAYPYSITSSERGEAARHSDAGGLRSLEIDDQLELVGCITGKSAGGAFEDFARVKSNL